MTLIRLVNSFASPTLILCALTGCAVLDKYTAGIGERQDSADAESAAMKNRRLDAREAALSKRARALDQREALLAKAASTKSMEDQYTANELLPPDAQPGQCFTRLRVPPQYEIVKERVLVEEASERLEVTKEATPARQKRVKIPAKYTTVSKRKLVRNGRMDWREILCDTNITTDRITQIQQALLQAGYDPGAIDGAVGQQTMKAVNAFQRAEGLPVDRFLNIATVKALGVSPN